MKEIKVKKITPIEDSVDAYQFLNNSIDDFLKNTSFSSIIEKYKDGDEIITFFMIFIFILFTIGFAFLLLNIFLFSALLVLFIYLSYLLITNTCFGFILDKIVKKIKKDHINLFYPLKNDEIINIIRENYSKKEIILMKIEHSNSLINQFEINKIIEVKNPKFINDNIDIIEEIFFIFNRSKQIIEKKKNIRKNQKEVIDIVNSPDFLENKYFNVEYGVENGPLLQEYLDGDKKDIIDYINNKCLEEYNRKSSFINIKN